MGIVFRQSIKTTIVIGFGAILGAVNVYLSTFVLTKVELGFQTNVIHVGAILQIFMMLGTGSALSIYIQKYKVDDVRRKVLLSLAFLTTFFTTILFTLIYVGFKEQVIGLYQLSDQVYVRKFYYWVPVLVLIWSFMTLFELYLVSQIKVAISAFAKEVLLRICNLALLGALFLQFINFNQFIIGSVVMYLVPVLVLFFFSYRTKGFGFSTNWKIFSKEEYKGIIHFSWYHLLFVAALNILGFLDTLMLAPLDINGMSSIAIYSRAVFIVGVMMIPYRAMSISSLPVLNQAYIDNDIPKLHDLFSRAGVNILIVAIAMTLVIGCNLDNAVSIFPKGYEAIKPLVLILMVGRVIDMITGLNNEMISISKYYKFNFRVSILLLIMVVLFNRILIPEYGMYGAAWGVTSALAIFNILKLLFLWNKMNLHPFTKGSLGVVAAGLVAGLAGYFFPYVLNPVIDTLVRTLVITIAYISMLVWLKPSPDINVYIKSVLSSRRLF